VRAADASLQLARQRYERASDLQAQGFVSPQATDQARAEQEVAMQKLRQAKGQLRVSDGDLGVVRAQLGLRKLRSAFDGVVVERYVNAGERVDDKPLLRLAKLDPLRVELVVPASRYGSLALKDRIMVAPELPGMAPVQARVTHIDPIIDAASNTFRVRLKLPNPDHKLPGGARCRVDLGPAGEVGPAVLQPARADSVGKVAG
jgi:membrane fusion protein, heavy metal efflux system